MNITNTKWLSLGVGGLTAWAALGLPESIITPAVGNPLFLFAVMAIIDFAISLKAIPYATIKGPEERREELDRRFYSWRKTTPRYCYIAVTSLAVFVGCQIEGTGDWYLYTMIAVMTGYVLLAIPQMLACRKEATALYPPNGS
jgi:hypothetical protein